MRKAMEVVVYEKISGLFGPFSTDQLINLDDPGIFVFRQVPYSCMGPAPLAKDEGIISIVDVDRQIGTMSFRVRDPARFPRNTAFIGWVHCSVSSIEPAQ